MIHKRAFRLTFILFVILHFYAFADAQQTITWAKNGNGAWHVNANWDLNRNPNAQDTVVINHDSVIIANGIDALAAKILLGAPDSNGVGLAVFNTGTLTIQSADTGIYIVNAALVNFGKIHEMGGTHGIIIDATSELINHDSITCESDHGIVNFNRLSNEVAGNILLDNSELSISNEDTILNHGHLSLEGSPSAGFSQKGGLFENSGGVWVNLSAANATFNFCGGIWRNQGSVNIQSIGAFEDIKLEASAVLENSDTITIISSAIRCINMESSTQLLNTGHIHLEPSDIGIMVSGHFTNEALGTIDIVSNISAVGISIGSPGQFENLGSILMAQINMGITVGTASTITNFGDIRIQDVEDGITFSGFFFNLGGNIEMTNLDFKGPACFW